MQKSALRTLVCLLALLPALAWAQAAGRVLLAVGEVSVERGAATIPLALNSVIFPGDTIRLGADSNAQVRFSDESIVGLRAGSVFRVDEYQFSQGSGKGIFSLLAGGMRTVTGQIGRLTQDRGNYAVRTPTSTIGIRGTHYTVVHCNNDCGNAKTASALLAFAATTVSDAGGPLAQAGGGGSSVPNGTYGGVTDGRISASPNEAPELGRDFGHDEYFYVATPNSAPQSLIAPPAFLHDRLSGQRRSSGQQGQESGETLAQGGINAESRPGSVPEGPQPSTFVVTEQRTGSGDSVLVPASAAGVMRGFGFALAELIDHDDGDTAAAGAFALLRLDASGMRLESATGTDPYDSQPYSLARNSAAFADLGGDAAAGNVFWGRWETGGTFTSTSKGTLTPTTGIHWIFGDFTPHSVIASRTGSLTFFHSSGTNPTDGSGIAGTMLSGSFGVNFTTQQVNGVVSYSFPGNTYTLSMPNVAIVAANGRAVFGYSPTGMVGMCTQCGGDGGGAWSMGGTFVGADGNGIIATWATQHNTAGASAGAGLFKAP